MVGPACLYFDDRHHLPGVLVVMTDPWRQEVNHQAVRDAVLFWWEHRRETRGDYEPGRMVGYMPLECRSQVLQHLAGRVGRVMQALAVDQRLIQFGGEEDGTVIVRCAATLDELLPL